MSLARKYFKKIPIHVAEAHDEVNLYICYVCMLLSFLEPVCHWNSFHWECSLSKDFALIDFL